VCVGVCVNDAKGVGVNLLGGCLMLLFRLIFDVVILGFENLGRGEFGGSKFKY